MELKKPKLPAEAIELSNVYIHGGMSRRDFLDGAKQFAVGGLTATAVVDALLPNYAAAEQVPKDGSASAHLWRDRGPRRRSQPRPRAATSCAC